MWHNPLEFYEGDLAAWQLTDSSSLKNKNVIHPAWWATLCFSCPTALRSCSRGAGWLLFREGGVRLSELKVQLMLFASPSLTAVTQLPMLSHQRQLPTSITLTSWIRPGPGDAGRLGGGSSYLRNRNPPDTAQVTDSHVPLKWAKR